MALETATYIDGLVSTNPVGATDTVSSLDDHIRLLKSTIKATFPSLTGAVSATQAQLNLLNSLAALSVLGVTGNSATAPAAIAAGSDHQVLRRSGTAVAFGSINLASSNAVTGALPVANGGTGSTSAADARTALGAQAALGFTPVKQGGANTIQLEWTGSLIRATVDVTPFDLVTSGDLGDLAALDTVNNSNWSGTDLAVTNGGTGASDAANARTNLGIGSIATRALTVSTSDPSGGSDGDVWFKYTA